MNYKNIFHHLLHRKHGISLLVPTQNAEKTVEICLRSFLDFADEIIVVDNGSTDRTIDIVKGLEQEIQTLRFFNAPHLTDLYENRQYALEQSQYNWIARIDSDFVAYTDGEYSSKRLRELVLSTSRSVRPIAFTIKVVDLLYDFHHVRGISAESANEPIEPNPVIKVRARIIQYTPFLRFQRNKRWEGIRGYKLHKRVELHDPYWFHCELKSTLDYFLRSERTNWRERGEFDKYPTVASYARDIAIKKYGTYDLEKASQIYMNTNILPYLVSYDPEKYYPYPEIIQNIINNENIHESK